MVEFKQFDRVVVTKPILKCMVYPGYVLDDPLTVVLQEGSVGVVKRFHKSHANWLESRGYDSDVEFKCGEHGEGIYPFSAEWVRKYVEGEDDNRR